MTRFKDWKPPEFDVDGYTEYGWRCQHHENLRLGKNVDIGCYSYLNAKYGIIIEDECQIGSHCSLYTESTIDEKKGLILLKKNACVGTHSTIMPHAVIGENSIVAAHSFVPFSMSIPPNEIWGGVPARKIKEIER